MYLRCQVIVHYILCFDFKMRVQDCGSCFSTWLLFAFINPFCLLFGSFDHSSKCGDLGALHIYFVFYFCLATLGCHNWCICIELGNFVSQFYYNVYVELNIFFQLETFVDKFSYIIGLGLIISDAFMLNVGPL